MTTINIVHLYAKEMNIYGDNGNVQVLKQRLVWRGIPVKVHHIGVGDAMPDNAHIIIGGGGQDAGQSKIADDLQQKSQDLHRLSEAQVPMLMICGMYQMFGHYFKTYKGENIPGIGLLDVHTIAYKVRLIGNITSQTPWGEVVGYENHSGLTYLGNKAKTFGSTKLKQGNNGQDKTEGAWQNQVFGSYMHGPMLAKSPEFADYLLSCALKTAGTSLQLKDIDNKLEHSAAATAKRRPR